MSSSRTGVHKLSNGLIVSGPPENRSIKRQLSETSRAMPYTGGNVKNSGELGKMVGIDLLAPPARPGPRTNSGPKTGSGPLGNKKASSSSGPINPIQPTGLITSGPVFSGPLGSNRRSSGQLADGLGTRRSFKKVQYGSGVTNMGTRGVRMEYRFPRLAMWGFLVVAMMGLLVGTFLYAAVDKPALLIVVITILVPSILGTMWNVGARMWGVVKFLNGYPDSDLLNAKTGDFVKVTGVVTCGSVPLETSYEKVPRCIYASTELHEYRSCGSTPANTHHRLFSWGCRHSENYVSDFYISDSKSGLRALVKAGSGAKVAPFVKWTTIIDSTKDDINTSPDFLCWLSERGLSTDDRLMRLKEAHIREGSEVTVMGEVRINDNVLMIIPPEESISTGSSWSRCLIPTYIEGMIISCAESRKPDAAVPV